jgi:hypothetical protein
MLDRNSQKETTLPARAERCSRTIKESSRVDDRPESVGARGRGAAGKRTRSDHYVRAERKVITD